MASESLIDAPLINTSTIEADSIPYFIKLQLSDGLTTFPAGNVRPKASLYEAADVILLSPNTTYQEVHEALWQRYLHHFPALAHPQGRDCEKLMIGVRLSYVIRSDGKTESVCLSSVNQRAFFGLHGRKDDSIVMFSSVLALNPGQYFKDHGEVMAVGLEETYKKKTHCILQ